MVQEFRRISFSKEELISALVSHRRRAANYLPLGDIADFNVIDKTSISVIIEPELNAEKIAITCSDAMLMQAVIRFCIENNIMLPRDSEKCVAVDEQGVSLCISLDVDTFLVNGMQPLRLYVHAS